MSKKQNKKWCDYTEDEKRASWIGLGVIVVILFIFLGYSQSKEYSGSSSSSSTSESSAEIFRDGESVTLTGNLPACTSEDNLSKLDNYMTQNNEEGKNRMLALGEVIIIPYGASIDIIDFGVFTTKIEYNMVEYYVHSEMIEH